MQRQPAKPTTDGVATSTANDPKRAKRGSLLHKLRLRQAMEETLSEGKSRHSLRRPAPSMPKLPWDNNS